MMPHNAEQRKQLEENISKAVEDLTRNSAEHGGQNKEKEEAAEKRALAEKELNDFKGGPGKENSEIGY